jgi:hypothetical protein
MTQLLQPIDLIPVSPNLAKSASGTHIQGTVEWRFAHLAKRKEDKTESVVPVVSSEAPPAEPKPATKSLKKGKLPPKNKSRLPRRQKKAQLKAAGRL